VKPSLLLATGLLASSAFADPLSTALLTTQQQMLTVREAERLIPRPLSLAPGTPDALRSFVSEVLVPHFLLRVHAATKGRSTPTLRDAEDTLLARAVEDDLHRASQVNDERIAAYYAAHTENFRTPEAVRVSRILVRDEAEARRLLATLGTSPAGLKQWGALAREHSLDTATKLRGGDLGFVHADGATDVPQVRVSRALYAAALPLRDGELAQPVREGEYFAVVWRRASRPARVQPLPDVRGPIRAALEREAVQTARAGLLATLRNQHLTEYQPELIESVNYPVDPGLSVAKPPLSPRPAAFTGKPVKGERGER
jgi:peptidyl-prolyl cis-trans isomerase C